MANERLADRNRAESNAMQRQAAAVDAHDLAIAREMIAHTGTDRSAARAGIDPRPFDRHHMSVGRFGSLSSPPPVPPEVVTAAQLRERILDLNRALAERHFEDEATKAERDRLVAELAALEGRAG